MNEEVVDVFIQAVEQQLRHGFKTYHKMLDEHGEEKANKYLAEALETSVMIEQMDGAGIRPSTFEEDMINASWPYLCILLDLELSGAYCITAPEGHRQIRVPEQTQE